MDVMLSDSDIRMFITKYNPSCDVYVYTYNEILKFKRIEDLVPKRSINWCVLLLYPWEVEYHNIGHWTCLTGGPDNSISFFDSYGQEIDEVVLAPYNQWLMRLLIKYKGKIYYNDHALQKMSNTINTCGRYCALWGSAFVNNTIDSFAKKYYQLCDELNLSTDELAVFLTI